MLHEKNDQQILFEAHWELFSSLEDEYTTCAIILTNIFSFCLIKFIECHLQWWSYELKPYEFYYKWWDVFKENYKKWKMANPSIYESTKNIFILSLDKDSKSLKKVNFIPNKKKESWTVA